MKGASIRSFVAAILMLGVMELGCNSATDESEPSTEPAAIPFSIVGPQKPEFLAIAERLENSDNDFFGTKQLDLPRRVLDDETATGPAMVAAHLDMSRHELRLGDPSAAVEHIEAAFDLTKSDVLPWSIRIQMFEHRSLAYLRQAEVSNCVDRHNADCCIFPLRNGGVHSVAEPAREAKATLLEWLEGDEGNLANRWLLNIAAMALNEYPDGVPERYRIPPAAFESDYDIGRFVDVAPALGVDSFNLCGGVIVQDFDNDDLLDIVTSTSDPRGPLTFYRNRGDGRFEDASHSSQLDDQLGGLNCVAADYDNDGDVDILVLRGAWLFDDGLIRNSLLRNDGGKTFKDVTRQAGLADPMYPTQAALWGDFDNDGDLDLFVGNESRLGFGSYDGGDFPSQLFQNNGDGTFTDVARTAGVTNDRYAKGVAAGDFDNDGDLDLYVSNIGPNRLYRNNGNGTFSDVAERLNVTEPSTRSFATWFFDYDNDGWLDLFVAAYDATLDDIVADYLGEPHKGVAPCLYRNTGKGGFVNVTRDVGLDRPYLPMGANFGDLDNDGFLDFYLTTGDPGYQTLIPNVMLRNDAGKRFQDVTTSGGFGHLQKGHGVGFADIDHDGDQDIYHQLGGFFPGDRFHNALFLNPGHRNHFLVIQLVGQTTNHFGIGARIKIVVDTPAGKQEFHRAVGCVSSFGGSPFRQEIGLGNATRIEQVVITWPTSRSSVILTDVPMDGMIRVREHESGFESVPYSAMKLQPTRKAQPLPEGELAK